MIIENDKISGVVDPVNAQDAMTLHQALQTAGSLPRVYNDGVRKTSVWEISGNASVAGGAGNVVLYLTDDGTSTGNAVFANVYLSSATYFVDSAISYNYSNWTVSGDKKTLTVKVSYPVISALVIIYSNAPNGTLVRFTVKGD